MSIIVTSLLVASGVLLGRYLARSRKPPEESEDGKKDEPKQTKKKEEGEPPQKMETLDGFVCQLGDVIMRSAGEEAWLAGALILKEQAPVAVLFVAPEAGGDLAVLARPSSEDVLWLAPVAPDTLGLVGKEPPASLEHGEDRFERSKRIPVRIDRLGSGAPDLGETAIYAEYTALGGERMIVLVGTRIAAFRGTVLIAGTFTVLPSGKASLE